MVLGEAEAVWRVAWAVGGLSLLEAQAFNLICTGPCYNNITRGLSFSPGHNFPNPKYSNPNPNYPNLKYPISISGKTLETRIYFE